MDLDLDLDFKNNLDLDLDISNIRTDPTRCHPYSCVGVWQHDRVEIIANDQGNRTTPSYVAFTDTERLIGDAAKNQVAMNPINTVFGMLALSMFLDF